MEAIGSSETSVETQQTTRHHIPDDDTLHTQKNVLCTFSTVNYLYTNGSRHENFSFLNDFSPPHSFKGKAKVKAYGGVDV
jgi:hypothetical protein